MRLKVHRHSHVGSPCQRLLAKRGHGRPIKKTTLRRIDTTRAFIHDVFPTLPASKTPHFQRSKAFGLRRSLWQAPCSRLTGIRRSDGGNTWPPTAKPVCVFGEMEDVKISIQKLVVGRARHNLGHLFGCNTRFGTCALVASAKTVSHDPREPVGQLTAAQLGLGGSHFPPRAELDRNRHEFRHW